MGATRYVAPTITVEPSPDSPVMQEEIFGPILPVLGVERSDEATSFVGARPKPLALYVFAQQDDDVDDVLDHHAAGGVCVNQTLMHILPADLPFGGVGDSGMGAYHGKAGFDTFSHRKSVLHKPTRPDLEAAVPALQAARRAPRPQDHPVAASAAASSSTRPACSSAGEGQP